MGTFFEHEKRVTMDGHEWYKHSNGGDTPLEFDAVPSESMTVSSSLDLHLKGVLASTYRVATSDSVELSLPFPIATVRT